MPSATQEHGPTVGRAVRVCGCQCEDVHESVLSTFGGHTYASWVGDYQRKLRGRYGEQTCDDDGEGVTAAAISRRA